MLGKRPTAVTGFGGIMDPDYQQDGRDVADTIKCVTQYSGKFNSSYDCTITNSFCIAALFKITMLDKKLIDISNDNK